MWTKSVLAFQKSATGQHDKLLHFYNNLLISADMMVTKITVKNITGLFLSSSDFLMREWAKEWKRIDTEARLRDGRSKRTALGHPSLSSNAPEEFLRRK